MKNYYNLISGGMTVSHLMAAMTIALIGFAFFKILTGLGRNRASHRTPAKFSFKFWLRDNWKEAAQGFLIMFVLIRFSSEIMSKYVPDSAQWIESNDPMWQYFVIGFIKTWVINALKKWRKK